MKFREICLELCPAHFDFNIFVQGKTLANAGLTSPAPVRLKSNSDQNYRMILYMEQ